MDAIIPAAGLATRMRGIPKFLLPCDEQYTTLIELHIQSLLEVCETVWIPTRSEMVMLLDSLGLSKDRVVVIPMQTENMTQTVARVLGIARTDTFQLVMPDTYFSGEKPYRVLNDKPELVDLACWDIRDEQRGKVGQVQVVGSSVVDIKDKVKTCEFQQLWGALTFGRDLLNYANMSDPHIGYAVRSALKAGKGVTAKRMQGKYFDCGTPSEYISMLLEAIAR